MILCPKKALQLLKKDLSLMTEAERKQLAEALRLVAQLKAPVS